MSDREKTLIAFLVIAIIGVIALIGTVIAKEQDMMRYKAIVEVSCERAYNPAQCKTGIKTLMNMSPEDIKNYKYIQY